MNKVLPVTVLLGLVVILVWSFNASSVGTVFAQTPSDPNASPVPEGNYTDPNTGPIPEDSSSTSPDNSTSTMQGDTLSNMPSSNPLANDTMAPDNMTGSQENMTSTQHSNPTNTHSNLPPLEQVKSGVSPKDVQCKQGFTLIIKVDDGSPACVDPQVAQILIQRGW